MNFKTPFKVLTTAALIGTLSLSAVAPGAASAAEKTATSFQAKAELTASHVVLEDAKGNLITLDYNTYLEAKSVGIDLGAEPISIKVGDKFYHLNDFLEAKSVSNNDLAEAVKLLDENNLSQDITPAEGAIEDGKLVVVPGDEDFKVTEIAAITTTTVDVKFPAVKADLTNKTIEVKDSKGQVRAVKAIDISEGDKEASFTFETPVAEADLVGTWTVDGAEYNFDAINQVEAINAAATTTPLNEIKLLNALNDAKIENVNEDKLADYATAIADAAPTTLADVQKVIDEENEVITDAEKEAAAVKAVAEATNQVQLLKALEANFERVNAEWIAAYAGGKEETVAGNDQKPGFIIADANKETANTVVKVTVNGLDLDDWTVASVATILDADNIQETIDAINGYQVSEAYDKAFKSLKAADVTAARTVANTYIADAEENADDFKGFAIDSLDILDAVIKVDAATTNNTLKKALTDLALLDETLAEKYNKTAAFDIETVVESNLPAYRTAIDKAEIGKKNQISDIQTIVTKVNTDTSDSLINAVKAATTKEELAKALKNLGVVQVADTNAAAYLSYDAHTDTEADYKGISSKETAQTLVDTVNLAQVAAATKSNIVEKLNVFGLDNVVSANAEAYVAAKATIGETANLGATNAATVKNVKADVTAVNKAEVLAAEETKQLKAINAAKTAEEVQAALTALIDAGTTEVQNFLAVNSADQKYIASAVLENRPATSAGYTALSEVTSQVDDAAAAITATLTAVKGITSDDVSTAKVLEALTDETTDEKVKDTDFQALTTSQKNAKAETFANALEFNDDKSLKTKFTSVSAIYAQLLK